MDRVDHVLATEWRRIRPIVWRSALVVLILACALCAFSMGVDVSDRPGVAGAALATKLYYSVGLFVLGGLDLGVPVGGSAMGRTLLWAAYFGAPAITGLAVVEGIVRTVSPDRFRMRRVRHHVVVVGAGNICEIYLERLQESGWSNPVVLLLHDDESLPSIPQGLVVIVVRGEIRSAAVISNLRLPYAERILLAVDDGLANLDAAATILSLEAQLGLKVIVHLSDLGLMRAVAGTRVANECTIFNSHHIAATYLVRSELLDWFDHTQEDDVVVLGGFGRFGQSVLGELQAHASGRFSTVIIVDPDGEAKAELFQYKVGFLPDAYTHHVVEANMGSPALWRKLESQFALSSQAVAIVLGCGNDGVNIRAALHAADIHPAARILTGVFGNSAFADDMARDKNLRVISVARLVKDSMPASWFEMDPRGLLDLVARKRHGDD